MGMMYGLVGMTCLVAAYWIDSAYTYGTGVWLAAVSMAPGAIAGLWTSYAVGMTALPEMVGAYNGFGGLAAALEGYGLYLDPTAIYLARNGNNIVLQTDSMLFVQGLALVLSIVIGMMTFTGSMVAVFKLNGMIASKSRIIPYRTFVNLVLLAAMAVFGALPFYGKQHWNDRGAGLTYLVVVGFLASLYGVLAVMGTYANRRRYVLIISFRVV